VPPLLVVSLTTCALFGSFQGATKTSIRPLGRGHENRFVPSLVYQKRLPIPSATIGHAATELPHAEMEHAFLPDGGSGLKSYWLVGSSVLSVSGVPRSDQ
jgi:hypothetical protein